MGSVSILTLVAVLLSAFFCGMEVAYTNTNKLKLEIERKQNGLLGFVSEVFVKNPGRYHATILVGNSIALVIYTLGVIEWVQSISARSTIPTGAEIVIEVLAATVFIVLVAVCLPMAVVRSNPGFWFRFLRLPFFVCYLLLYPVTRAVMWISFAMLRLAGIPVGKEHTVVGFDKGDLEDLLEESAEGEGEQENEIRIFQNALDFSDVSVRDCMIPRVDMEAVEIDAGIDEITERFVQSKYSRIFVWEGSVDNIVGYVNVKSLFRNPKSVREALMKVDFVPETMPAERLLTEFIKRKNSVAVVIDEFGGTAGIISMEDVLEEIFGEIEDEHDSQDMIEKKIGETEYLFSCRLEVKYLNEKYDLGIEESEEYDTLAGYIIYHENGIPPVGKVVVIDNKHIKILQSSSSRLELARIKIV